MVPYPTYTPSPPPVTNHEPPSTGDREGHFGILQGGLQSKSSEGILGFGLRALTVWGLGNGVFGDEGFRLLGFAWGVWG